MPGSPNLFHSKTFAHLRGVGALAAALLGCSDSAAPPGVTPAPTCFDYASTPQFGGASTSIDVAREILVDGTLAYVANAAVGVLVYDVSNRDAPSLVGQYSTSGRIDALAKQGHLLLATDERNRRLLVLDATTPAGLALLGFVGFQSMPHAVVVRGQHAFVTTFEFTNDAALHAVDFSNPSAPFIASTTLLGGAPYDLAIKDAMLYIVTAREPDDFVLYDVSTPTAPRFHDELHTPGPGINFVVAGNRGYVAGGSRGVHIYDLTTAGAPRSIGNFDSVHDAQQVQVDGTRVFVYRRPFIEVADVSNPSAPRGLGTVWLDLDAFMLHAGWMHFWLDATFHLQDYSAPQFASVTTRVGLAAPGQIELRGDVAYVNAQNRVEILDVSGNAPEISGSVAFASALRALAADDSVAYVSDTNGIVYVLDVADPAMARSVGSVVLGDDVLDLALHGTRVYALERRFGLRVIDASTPSAPQLAGSLSLGTSVLAMAASGDIVCVDNTAGIRIVDASVPSAPVQIGEIAELAIRAMEMRGSLLVLATYFGLVVYDLTDPAFPVLTSRQEGWPNWALAESIAFDATHAYVVSGPGVRVFDMTDATSPRYVGFYDLPRGTAYDAAAGGDRLYLSTSLGLDVLLGACSAALY